MEENKIKSFSLRKIFLITFIATLCLSALIAIWILLAGEIGDIQWKVIITTFFIGFYSLTSLISAYLMERKSRLTLFSYASFILYGIGFIYSTLVTWEILIKIEAFGDAYRALFTFLILSIAIAHVSLLLILKNIRKTLTLVSFVVTTVFIGLVSFMLINIIYTTDSIDDFYFRLLGVFAILNVLGTILTPIFNKIEDKKV